jgi:hypothetical protein
VDPDICLYGDASSTEGRVKGFVAGVVIMRMAGERSNIVEGVCRERIQCVTLTTVS